MSLSAAVYGFAGQSYEIEGTDFQADNASFITYPTTAAWIQRLRGGDADDGAGRVQLAFAVLTPRSGAYRLRLPFRSTGQDASSGQLTELQTIRTRLAEDDTLWGGVAVSWKIFRHLSIGASVFVTYRSAMYQTQNASILRVFNAAGTVELTRVGLSSWTQADLMHVGLLGVLGVVAPITGGLRVGASFRSPLLELHGDADFQSFYTDVDGKTGRFELKSERAEGVTFRDRQPWKAALGVAWVEPRHWGASADFALYGGVGEHAVFEDDARPDLEGLLRSEKRMVWQVNVGGEYYVLGVAPLRLGFFTNRSSYEPVTVCQRGACAEGYHLLNDPVDMYGVSGSVGYETDHVGLNLGVTYSYGKTTLTETVEGSRGMSFSYDVTYARSFLYISIGGVFRF